MNELANVNKRIWDDYIAHRYDEVRNLDIPTVARRSDRSVVIIEPRKHPHLEFCIRSALHFLEKDWGLQIFVGKDNLDFVTKLTEQWGGVKIVNLNVSDLTARQYNQFKRSAELWQQVQSEHVLWIEPDCILRRRGVEEYLSYDYVGAPWGPGQAISPACRVGNGGLSVRRRSAMLSVAEQANPDHLLFAPEDMYFSVNMHLANCAVKGAFNLPSFEVARKFAVETVYHPDPVGLHKTWKYVQTRQLMTLLNSIVYK